MKRNNRQRTKIYGRLRLLGRLDVVYILGVMLAVILFGAWVFHRLEGWSIPDAIYATVITLTTVGYGDFVPVTPAGRTFATFFTLLAVGIVGYTVSSAAAFFINRQQKRARQSIWERKMQRVASLNNHYILCGANPVGRRIAKEFLLAKKAFIIIDTDANALHKTFLYLQGNNDLLEMSNVLNYSKEFSNINLLEELNNLSGTLGIPYLLRDATHNKTLLQAGITYAKGLVTASKDDKENLFIILTARQLVQEQDNTQLRIVSRATEEEHINKLKAAGADRIVSPNAIGSIQLAAEMLRPASSGFWDKILEQDKRAFNISLSLISGKSYIGKTIDTLRNENDLAIVGLLRNGEFLPTLTQDTRIESGDELIIAVSR